MQVWFIICLTLTDRVWQCNESSMVTILKMLNWSSNQGGLHQQLSEVCPIWELFQLHIVLYQALTQQVDFHLVQSWGINGSTVSVQGKKRQGKKRYFRWLILNFWYWRWKVDILIYIFISILILLFEIENGNKLLYLGEENVSCCR